MNAAYIQAETETLLSSSEFFHLEVFELMNYVF